MTAPTFREKYEWFRANASYPEAPAEIERLYDEAHPPKVTAEDVWQEVMREADPCGPPSTLNDGADIAHVVLCEEVARHRNAAREAPDDEAWIEAAADVYFDLGAVRSRRDFVDSVRTAYRYRARAEK